ncbi:MAG: TetR/AcrR family transcriptional regulator [Rhodopseudomonas palustris]|nr:MAG: TetR/AcrR family transcriptional regulator [Rhodopseudomonas palustris]
MRYSKEHKNATHDRIVRKASMRLREQGIHGVGVAELMKDAGLTHGGFYSHFESREALMVEAVTYAMDRSMASWRELADDLPPSQRLAAIADAYLSKQHRDDPGRGCAVLAVGAEIARETAKTRRAFAAKVTAMIELLAEQMEGVPAKQARQQASAMLASMVGTLLLARITGAGELSDEILAAGRAALPVVPASPRRGGSVTVSGSRAAASAAKADAGAARPAVKGKAASKPGVRRAAASKAIASKTIASKAIAGKVASKVAANKVAVAASKPAANKALASRARTARRSSNGTVSSQQR